MFEQIINLQRTFQEHCGLPINGTEEERNQLAETYLYKCIDEIIELKDTFPSSLNKYRKNQPVENRDEMRKELCDVILWLINFCLAKKIDISELDIELVSTINNNFNKLYEKLGKEAAVKLNESISKFSDSLTRSISSDS